MDAYQQQEQAFYQFLNESGHTPLPHNGIVPHDAKSPNTTQKDPAVTPSYLTEKPLTGLQCLFALTRILETSAKLHQLNAGLEEEIGYLNQVRELREIQNELQSKIHGRDVNANSLHNQSLDEFIGLSQGHKISKSKSNENLPHISEKHKLSLADDRKHSGLPAALKFGKGWDMRFGRSSMSSSKVKRSKTNDMSVVDKLKYRQTSLSSEDTLSITSAPGQTAFVQRQFNIPSVDSEDFGGVYLGEEPENKNEGESNVEDGFGGIYLGPTDQHEMSGLQSGGENSQLSLSSPVPIEQATVNKQRKVSEPIKHQPIADISPRYSLDDSNSKSKKSNKAITNKVMELITPGSAEKTQIARKSPIAERKPKTSATTEEDKLKLSKHFARKIDEWNQIKSNSQDRPDLKEVKNASKKSTGVHESRDKGKTKAQRFKGRKKGLLKGRSKSADRLRGSDEDFNQKLIEWSIIQGHQPDYYLNAPQSCEGSLSYSNGALDSPRHTSESQISADHELDDNQQSSSLTNENTLENLSPPTEVLLRHGDIRKNLSKSDEALQTKSRFSSSAASSSLDIYTETLDSSLEKHLSLRYLDTDGNSVDRLSIKTDDLDTEVLDPEDDTIYHDNFSTEPTPAYVTSTEANVTPTEGNVTSIDAKVTTMDANVTPTKPETPPDANMLSTNGDQQLDLQAKASSSATTQNEISKLSPSVDTVIADDITNAKNDAPIEGAAINDQSTLAKDPSKVTPSSKVLEITEQTIKKPTANQTTTVALETSHNADSQAGKTKPKIERTVSKSVPVEIGDSPYEFLLAEPSPRAIQCQLASSGGKRVDLQPSTQETADFDAVEHSSVIHTPSIVAENALKPDISETKHISDDIPANSKSAEPKQESAPFDFDRVKHSSKAKALTINPPSSVEPSHGNSPTILDFEDILKPSDSLKEQTATRAGSSENMRSSPDGSIGKDSDITDFDSVKYSGKPELCEPFSSESLSEGTGSSESLNSAQEDSNEFDHVQFSQGPTQHKISDTSVFEESMSPVSPTMQRLSGMPIRPNRLVASYTNSERWLEADCDINSNRVPLGQTLSVQSVSQMSIASNEYVTAPTTPLDDPIYLGPEVPLKAKLKSLAMAYQAEDEKRLQAPIKTTRPNSMTYDMPPLQTEPVHVSHARSRSNDELLTNGLGCVDTNDIKSDKIHRYGLSSSVKSGVYRLKSADELLQEKNAMIERAKQKKHSNESRQTGIITPNVLELSYHRKKDEVPKQGTVKKAMSIFSSRESNLASFGMDFSGK